jgi:hypothetical protein
VLVARGPELHAQLFQVEALALLEEEGVPGDIGGRAQAHQRGGRGHHRDIELAALDAVERGEALGHQVLVRRELVVGQRFPVGQQAHAQRRREPGDLLDQALRIQRGRRDHRQRLFAGREPREDERIRRAREPGVAPAGGKRIAVHQAEKRVIISL